MLLPIENQGMPPTRTNESKMYWKKFNLPINLALMSLHWANITGQTTPFRLRLYC